MPSDLSHLSRSVLSQGNILISDDGTACLGDFGITNIITDAAILGPDFEGILLPDVLRYTAPELLNSSQLRRPNSSPTKESDVYSFVMTAYEVPSSHTARGYR